MTELVGTVGPGQGLGVERMTRPVLDLIRSRTGIDAISGTLNVRLGRPVDESLFPYFIDAADISPDWVGETGQSGYWWVRISIEGRFEGVAARAVEPDYPDDLVEIVCGVHLRSTLDLKDGDTITMTVL